MVPSCARGLSILCTRTRGLTTQDCVCVDEQDGHEDNVFVIVCPEGTMAGQTISVIRPGGQEVELTVPQGVNAGEEFEVCLNASRYMHR